MKINADWKVAIVAIIVLGTIEIVALFLGYNGTLLRWMTLVIAAIAGVVTPLDKIKKIIKR